MRQLLLLLLVFLSTTCFGQIKIFKTHYDFENDKGEEYVEYKSCSYPGGNVRLFFIDQQGNKKKIACKNIWGFKYGDALFRTEPRSSQPARVMSLGEIVYYENGLAHLEMIRDNSTTGRSDLGYYSYISPNLKAPMTPLPNFGFSSKARRMRELLKIHPEYKPLFECLEKDYDLKTVIYCVIEFEELME